MRNSLRFSFGRQSSLDPIRRSPLHDHAQLSVPENLDSTMQLLFMASRGDVKGVEDLLDEGVDVNNIDLDGRTALHIAACEGHVEVVKLLLSRRANIDARDRWGSTVSADAKYYGNVEVYNILKARGAKALKTTRKTPMAVANPREIPEYELNPLELQVRKSDGIAKAWSCSPSISGMYQVAKWNGTKVAVKILEKERCANPEGINAFKHELTLLEKVRHPNLIQFVGAVTQNFPMMIVAEFHSKGDLACYLQKKGRFSASKALRFALDIARQGHKLPTRMQTISDHPLRFKAKVAGFGLIRLSNISPCKAKLAPGTPIDRSNVYMAPEIYKDEIFDRSVDAYSFGALLYEMLEGVQPFYPKSPEEAVKLMCLENKRPQFKIKLRSYPPDLRELIDECWLSEPVGRPTFSEIITRLDRICSNCSKQGWLKDTFTLPW
ncbi:hypothetical protein DKX38_011958 [Salix brachista]|nr:hypothetical protein DKX38_011958 [Salix brachista]